MDGSLSQMLSRVWRPPVSNLMNLIMDVPHLIVDRSLWLRACRQTHGFMSESSVAHCES